MIAADRPRHEAAKLLIVDGRGALHHSSIAELPDLLHPGDLVVANDAATLPASLRGTHMPTGDAIEVRLAGRPSASDETRFIAIVFGAGDYRIRTEDRPAPPVLCAGDRLALGPMTATVERVLGHPRLIVLRFEGRASELWDGVARHGRAIQYAHVPRALELWDVWTKIAGAPVAFEPPSAGFALTWSMLAAFAKGGVGFVTLTLAAGISSTGDAELDKRLPFDEAYDIPRATVAAVRKTKSEGGRVIAIGTSVVRALEHAAKDGALHAGAGVAAGRLGPSTRLKLVDAIVSGVHAPGESHFELLRAFVPDDVLRNMAETLEESGFRNHEFGDFVLIERRRSTPSPEYIAAEGGHMRYFAHGQ